MTATTSPLRDDFIWGAATAAHQIEGNNINADFWIAEHAGLGGHIQEPSGDACDSYHRYRDDIRLLAEGGLKAYRFSTEWARIEPEDGFFSRATLLHYRAMIDTCHEFGVLPIVTLHHFTSPRWFALGGSLLRPDAAQRFASYVSYVAPILHDIEWIVTINEPNILNLFGSMRLAAQGGGEVPTIEMGALPAPSLELVPTIVAMHKAAVRVLREQVPNAKLGWAPAAQAFMPTEGNEAVWERVFHQWEGVYYDACDGDDFVGVQSYTSQPVDANGPVPHPPSPDNTLTGWAYRPDALGINIRRIHERYGIPILVTENGIATTDDSRRIAYTTAALQGLMDAVEAGADVRGYCHWSLLDNYEWGRWEPTFGLIAVDRTGDFTRTPKPSLAWLGSVAATNGASLR